MCMPKEREVEDRHQNIHSNSPQIWSLTRTFLLGACVTPGIRRWTLFPLPLDCGWLYHWLWPIRPQERQDVAIRFWKLWVQASSGLEASTSCLLVPSCYTLQSPTHMRGELKPISSLKYCTIKSVSTNCKQAINIPAQWTLRVITIRVNST